MSRFKHFYDWIKRILTLENRVTNLEKQIAILKTPKKDINEGLEYNKKWNYYTNKTTGENFCATCLGNGKRIPVVTDQNSNGEGWDCQNCKASNWKYNNSYDPCRIIVEED